MARMTVTLLALLLLSSDPWLAWAEPVMEQASTWASMQVSMQALCQCADDGMASAAKWSWALAGPVCGSDGQTYPSRCDLECAAAASARLEAGLPPLSLHYEGPCSSSTPSSTAHALPSRIVTCAVQTILGVPSCIAGRSVMDCIIQSVMRFTTCVFGNQRHIAATPAMAHLDLPLPRAQKPTRSQE